jgi:lambda family phage tail tape measure protein
MEDDYVSYVMDETLSDDEITYVNKALESDNTSAEFTGAGEVDGPGTGTSDEIPARLSDGEFVFTKKAVDQIGVETLERMMKDAEAEYDVSRQDMAVGGIMNDPTQDEKAMLPCQIKL